MLITRANSGIGFETSIALAGKGAQLVMACRDQQKAEEAKKPVISNVSDARILPVTLDLAGLDSVRTCAETVIKTHPKLDVLINNAGYTQTKQEFELQFGSHYLGHYALTGLVLPLLLATPDSRIVSLSSSAANYAKFDFDDIVTARKNIQA